MEKKNQKTKKLIYKIVTAITLFAPLPLYLFLMATLFNIDPDYIIYTEIENVEVLEIVEDEEQTFFITTINNAKMDGVVEFKYDKYGIVITEEDIIKIDKNYYSYIENKEKENVRELVDIKKFEVQKQQSYKLPISFFISLFAVLIVVLIIQGKMQWHKKHPRLAVLVALLTGTVILFILNSIIGSMLGVFAVATASWAVYCLEYLVYQNSLDEKDKANKESEILRALRGLIE